MKLVRLAWRVILLDLYANIYIFSIRFEQKLPHFSPTDGSITYFHFAYPLRKDIAPLWLAIFIAFMTPFVFFVLFQIHQRSIEDFLTTTLSLLKSLSTASYFWTARIYSTSKTEIT